MNTFSYSRATMTAPAPVKTNANVPTSSATAALQFTCANLLRPGNGVTRGYRPVKRSARASAPRRAAPTPDAPARGVVLMFCAGADPPGGWPVDAGGPGAAGSAGRRGRAGRRAGDGRAARRGPDRHDLGRAALTVPGALEPARRPRPVAARSLAAPRAGDVRVLGARRIDPADGRLPALSAPHDPPPRAHVGRPGPLDRPEPGPAGGHARPRAR